MIMKNKKIRNVKLFSEMDGQYMRGTGGSQMLCRGLGPGGYDSIQQISLGKKKGEPQGSPLAAPEGNAYFNRTILIL